VSSLQAIGETGQPPLGTRLMYCVFDPMAFVLPARTKRDTGPLKLS
jgi:hypothetical protein